MSRPKTIDDQTIAQHCAELIAQGEKPSVRKLHQRLGGSFSTLSEGYQRWRNEQALAAQGEGGELSEAFRQAVLAEIGRATEALRRNLTQQLLAEQAQVKETQDLLARLETESEQLTRQLLELQKTTELTQVEFEKQLAAAQALVEDGQRRQADCQRQIEALREKAHEAELKAVAAETRCQELLKRNEKLELDRLKE